MDLRVAESNLRHPHGQAARPRPLPESAEVRAGNEALDRCGMRSVITRGSSIFYEGDPADWVYKVVSGAIRTSKLMADGRRYIADFLFPGDFFGLNDRDYRTFTAEAICDAIIVRWPRRVFDGAVANDPRLGRYLLTMLCGGLSVAHGRMLLLGRKTAVERIATFLVEMAARESGDRIELPMTRADIADYLGLTVETVSRVLTQLKSDRVIQLAGPTHVKILDEAALHGIAEGT